MATISGTNSSDSLNGTTGSDTISSGNGNDYVYADAGDDYVDGGNGDDILEGGDGDDILLGANGNDTLFGGLGKDTLSGGNGVDKVYGGAGDDVIGSGISSSTTNSENGADILYGDGYDSYADFKAGIKTSAVGNDTIYGGNGVDTIYGDNGDNAVIGGNDIIFGQNGDDRIFGEGGDDVITGGLGADILSGGAGKDTFAYNAASESNTTAWDVITDFKGVRDAGPASNNDKIDLRPFLGAADLNWGNTTPTANGIWYQQSGGNTFVYADVDGDKVADLKIQLNGIHDLSNVDFLGVTNAAPVITSNGGGSTATASVNENSTAVTTVTATDPDAGATLTYSIVGGADAALFTINATTGALSFISAPNAEAPTDSGANNVYDVIVRASNGTLFDDQAIAVTINDVDEFDVSEPADSDATVNAVAENAAAGTVVGVTAFASDADATNHTVSYSLTSNPGGLFAIDANTGAVTVASAIDREAVGASVDIEVTATSTDGSSAAKTFTIAINGLNDNTPVITSNGGDATAEVSIAENTTAVTTVTAIDADQPPQTLTYSVVGGADAAKFTINITAGALSFVSAPNFEAPTDASADNVYDVTVRASDGTLFDDQAIAVTVTNVNEAPVANGDAVITNIALGTGILIPAQALFANDTDAENSPLSIGTVVVTAPSDTVAISSGNVLYTDNSPSDGSFTYTAFDGTSQSAPATVTVDTRTATSLTGTSANEIFIGSSGNGEIYNFDLTGVSGFGKDAVRDAGGSNEEIHILTSSPTDSAALTALNFERVGNDLVIKVNDSQITVYDQYIANNALNSIQFTNGGTIFGYALSNTKYALNIDTSSPLDGTNNEDMIAGTSSTTGETLNGANKNDLLFGNAGDDTLSGVAETICWWAAAATISSLVTAEMT